MGFLSGGASCIVGKEDEFNAVKEVIMVLLAHACTALGQGKEIVHVDIKILEELGSIAWGDAAVEVLGGPTGG